MAGDELKCPNCGAKVDVADHRCTACGAMLDAGQLLAVPDPEMATRDGEVEPEGIEPEPSAAPQPTPRVVLQAIIDAEAEEAKKPRRVERQAEIDPERRRWAIVIICITIGACLALFASTLWPNVPGMSVFTVLIIVMGGFLGRRLARYMEEREEAGEQRSKARRDLATWEDLKLTLRAFWTVIVVAAVVVWLAGRWAGPHLPIPDEWKRVFGWVIEGDGVQTDSELDAEGGE